MMWTTGEVGMGRAMAFGGVRSLCGTRVARDDDGFAADTSGRGRTSRSSRVALGGSGLTTPCRCSDVSVHEQPAHAAGREFALEHAVLAERPRLRPGPEGLALQRRATAPRSR